MHGDIHRTALGSLLVVPPACPLDLPDLPTRTGPPRLAVDATALFAAYAPMRRLRRKAKASKARISYDGRGHQ